MTETDSGPVRNKLIVALDFPSADAASRAVEQLRGHAGMFKVGSELFSAEGPALVRDLVERGDKVFLDLKFHDIPNTVRAAARQAAQLGVQMFTIHASGGRKMVEAAIQGAREGSETASQLRPKVIAVTVLTSLSSEDLAEIGFAERAKEAVVRLARLAQDAGADGVVASPKEITVIRKACGPHFLIVTPGIRPALAAAAAHPSGAAPDDQARVATPLAAIQAGADFVVVGRPITHASDPAAAADAIVGEMEKATKPVASGMWHVASEKIPKER